MTETTDPTPLPEPDNAMVDLETGGTANYSLLLSIGACAMRLDNDDPITDLFYQPITLESSLAAGMRMSASTLKWWMTNESVTPEARAQAFANPEAVPLANALDAFTDWLNSRPLKLWGNSARFDLGLLEAAYLTCGKEIPWQHWDERCYRTVKNLPKAREVKLVRIGTHHHPTHDAVSQARHLRAINQQLQLHL